MLPHIVVLFLTMTTRHSCPQFITILLLSRVSLRSRGIVRYHKAHLLDGVFFLHSTSANFQSQLQAAVLTG